MSTSDKMPANAFIKQMAELVRNNPTKSLLAALCLFFGGFYLTLSPYAVRNIVYLEPVGLSREIANGDAVEEHRFSTEERFSAMTVLASGNIAICFSSSYRYYAGKAYLALVRPDGNVLWQQELPNDTASVTANNGSRLAAMPDGGILIYSTFGWVRKYNEAGECLWHWEADKEANASLYAALPLPMSKADGLFLPGGVLVGGSKSIAGKDAKEPWLFVLDEAGRFGGEFALQRPEPLAPDTTVGHWGAAPLEEPPRSVDIVDGISKVFLKKGNAFVPWYLDGRDIRITALAYDADASRGGKPCVLAAMRFSEHSSSNGTTTFAPSFSWLLTLAPSGAQTDIAYFPNTAIETVGMASGVRFIFGTTNNWEDTSLTETYLVVWPVGKTSPTPLPRPFMLHLTNSLFARRTLITPNGSVAAVFSFPYSLGKIIPFGTVIALYGPDGKIKIKYFKFRGPDEVAGVLAVRPDGNVLVGGQERMASGHMRLWLGLLPVQ